MLVFKTAHTSKSTYLQKKLVVRGSIYICYRIIKQFYKVE